jgi:ribosomal 50S subunit-recycling heat shock protein
MPGARHLDVWVWIALICRYAIDGCATFFRRDRFSLVKKYEVKSRQAAVEAVITGAVHCNGTLSKSTSSLIVCLLMVQVEFNKAALSLAESFTNPAQKKNALNRLLKVRVLFNQHHLRITGGHPGLVLPQTCGAACAACFFRIMWRS